MIRLLSALLAMLVPVAAQAHELEGRWAFRIDTATIFVFELDRAEDGEWHGTWTRPETFASNGAVFARLVGSKVLTSSAGIEFAGDIELTFDDPAPGAIPDIFRFRHLDEGRAQMTYVGTPLAPYPLIAVPRGTGLGPFAAGMVYDRDNAVSDPGSAPLPPPAPAPPPPMDEDTAAARLGADFLEGL
jgi:hypothetical protein